MPVPRELGAVVVGGGFYGCVLALHLRRERGVAVTLVEREDELLRRASYANQARVHDGYHYPRSLVTARRSRVNFPRFVEDYRECIDDSFEKIYAIARAGAGGSKVTAGQFVRFCKVIGAPLEPAPREIARLFEPRLVEAVFRVRETAFDAVRLRARLAGDLAEAGVEVRLGAEAARVEAAPPGLRLHLADGSALEAGRVLNCTYSRLNELLSASGLPRVELKQEIAELALVDLPEPLRGLGVTVMCGPFFSCMPFPPRGLHSLSHVRYTPRCEWLEGPERAYRDPYALFDAARRETAFPHMIRDARRYLPALREARHVDSLWEIKTVLPRNEIDDGRPILLVDDCGLPGLACVMGSKIDNVYDVLDCLA